MNKKLILAMLMVAVMAVPAFASVQNVKVSGFVNSAYLYRDRFDLADTGDGTNVPQFEQHLFITWTGLRVDADLTDKVKAMVQLLNERPWGDDNVAAATSNNEVVVHLANVQLNDILDSNVSATVGRQQFNYGNGFIVGTIGQNNETSTGNALSTVAVDQTIRTAYDGVKLVVDYNPLVVDLIAVKVDSNNSAGGSGAKDDDIDLFGANFNYQLGDQWNSVLEAYFFSRIDQAVKTKTALTVEGAKADSVYTPGLRASTNPIKGLNVQGEVAWQLGNRAQTAALDDNNQQREALGAQVIANYQIPFEKTAKWNPVVTGVYTYVSGDTNAPITDDLSRPSSSEKWTAWDPLFENQGGGKIYNVLFDLTNCHIVEVSTQVNPMEDVTAKFTWTGMWLDKSIYTVVGGSRLGNGTLAAGTFFLPDTTAWTPRITSNRGLGYEVDADFTYDYTEDVQLGLSLGWFFPGNTFDSSFNDNAKQALASLNVAF